MIAHPSGLVGAEARAEGLRIQGAVRPLGHAIAFDQVGIELLASMRGAGPPFGMVLVVLVLGLRVGGADISENSRKEKKNTVS